MVSYPEKRKRIIALHPPLVPEPEHPEPYTATQPEQGAGASMPQNRNFAAFWPTEQFAPLAMM